MNYVNFIIYSSLLTWFVNICIGFFVFFKNPGRNENRSFAALNLSIASWTVGSFIINIVSFDIETKLQVMRFCYFFSVLLPSTFLWHIYGITRHKIPIHLRYVCLITSVILLISLPTPLFIRTLRSLPGTDYLISAPGFSYFIFIIYFSYCACIGFFHISRMISRTQGQYKNQLKYVTIGYFIALLGGIDYFLTVFNILETPPIDDYILFVAFCVIAYAIARYRLLDIERAVLYVFLAILVYVPLLGIPFWINSWLEGFLGPERASRYDWVPLVAMALFASSGPFIYLRLVKRAERKKIKARNERLKKLKKISANMVFMTQKKSLMQAMVHQVVKIMQLTHAAVYVRIPQEEEQELEGVQKQGQKKKEEIKRVYQLGDHWGPGFPKISLLESLTEGASVLVDCLSREEFRKSEQALEQDGIRHWADRWGLTAEETGALEVVMLGMSAGVVIPAYEASGRLFGFLVLGAKRDGSVLEPEELSELMILANHGASAIQAAEGLAEQKRQQAELFHAAALANLGTMAGNIGHQINNRLQSLSAMAGNLSWRVKNILLKDGTDPAKKEEVLKDLGRLLPKMEEETVRAGNIAKSIRRLAKPEGYKETEFEKVVEFVQEMAVYKIKVEEIDFEVVMAKPLGKIWGDIALLAEVFLNLIDNGNDAIEERKERIQRKELPWNQPTPYRGKILLRSRKEGEWVITEVVDSGIGIKPEDMKKLFTPFWTTKGSSGKGTGLGVHVLHKIILAHGGKIEVESQYAEKTKFIIRLPVYRGGAQANADEKPKEKE